MRDLGRLLVCAALLWGVPGCPTPTEKRRLETERLDTKRLDDFYEGEWVKCVNDLGMDRCRIIQETGFRQCKNHRSVGGHSDIAGCMDARFKDRFATLPEKGEGTPPVEEAPLPVEAPETPGAALSEKF